MFRLNSYFSLDRPSTHQPWRIHPVHWPQPGAHTPISHSTPQEPAPSVAWDSQVRAALHPSCSVADSRSVRPYTHTGTCSWERRPGRPGRLNRPTHRLVLYELGKRNEK